MRCFKKSLLLLLENFGMKNSILVHEIIYQTLSFIFNTFYYYFKRNQRNLCYNKKFGNMNSKLPKINLESITGGIFQHLLVRIILLLLVQTKFFQLKFLK